MQYQVLLFSSVHLSQKSNYSHYKWEVLLFSTVYLSQKSNCSHYKWEVLLFSTVYLSKKRKKVTIHVNKVSRFFSSQFATTKGNITHFQDLWTFSCNKINQYKPKYRDKSFENDFRPICILCKQQNDFLKKSNSQDKNKVLSVTLFNIGGKQYSNTCNFTFSSLLWANFWSFGWLLVDK